MNINHIVSLKIMIIIFCGILQSNVGSVIDTQRPNIIVVDKTNIEIIDFAIPEDACIGTKL